MSKLTLDECREHLVEAEEALAATRVPETKAKIREEIRLTKKEIRRLEALERELRSLSPDDPAIEHAGGYRPAHEMDRRTDRNPARDAGLRAIARHEEILTPHAADVLDALVRDKRDRQAFAARYLEAVENPHYESCFGKLLEDPQHGHLRFTKEEVDAMQRVTAIQSEQRAMSLTGASGGFAVPFSLDPSVLLTSSGAIAPIRQLARVVVTPFDQWKGVSSAGVVANYGAELSEVADGTPTLAQPVIDCAKGHAFVPFSLELDGDMATLQSELTRLIADGRDVLDATQMLTGTGTDSPAGVLTGLSAGQEVSCAATGFPAVADHYSLRQAVPARFSANLSFVAHPAQFDRTYRLTPAGSTTEPQMLPTREGPLLGRPKAEWSTMANVSTAGSKLMLAGDFRAAFTIADRLGMTAEIVPHIFGASQRPIGARGLYVYWRTGSKVLVPEALRVLKTI